MYLFVLYYSYFSVVAFGVCLYWGGEFKCSLKPCHCREVCYEENLFSIPKAKKIPLLMHITKYAIFVPNSWATQRD